MTRTPHPSLGRPIRWVLVGEQSGTPSEHQATWVDQMAEASADAVLLDATTAAHIAPGVRPRPHAVVVRAWQDRQGAYPESVVVTPSYGAAPTERPSGLAMVRAEGSAVGDAIAVGRCAGLRLEVVAIPASVFEAYEAHEGVFWGTALTEFIRAATHALRSTLSKEDRG